jgi:uridylate kinase
VLFSGQFMVRAKRVVFLKVSGERLGKGNANNYGWHPNGVRSTRDKLAQAYRVKEDLGISGITVISGAGNIVRGAHMRAHDIAPKYADVVGRLGLIQNTIVIAEALDEIKIPNQILLTEKMQFVDKTLGLEKYSSEAVAKAHKEGKIVLIAGGTGEDNVTTDNAVVFYASDYSKKIGGEVTVLKGTQVDGVFEDDPAKVVNAGRFKTIGAPYMLKNYERFKVVDKNSLEQLQKSGLSMLVYADGGHDIENVLRHDPRYSNNGASIGTVILPESTEAIYY